LSYLLAANFQAAGLIAFAVLSGGWLNDRYPLKFAAGWYSITFGIALVAIVYTYIVMVRAAWRIEKRRLADKVRCATLSTTPSTALKHELDPKYAFRRKLAAGQREAYNWEDEIKNKFSDSLYDEFDLEDASEVGLVSFGHEEDPAESDKEEAEDTGHPKPTNTVTSQLDEVIEKLVDRELENLMKPNAKIDLARKDDRKISALPLNHRNSKR